MATIESGKWIAFWLKSACCSTCTKKIKKGDLSGEAGWRGLDWQNETEGETKGEWRARFVRHWYEKDKLIPVNPAKVPVLDEEKLKMFPTGYRYLAYCQEETMGVRVMLDMPGHRREPDTASGKKHDQLYWQCKQWVEGEEVDI